MLVRSALAWPAPIVVTAALAVMALARQRSGTTMTCGGSAGCSTRMPGTMDSPSMVSSVRTHRLSSLALEPMTCTGGRAVAGSSAAM